MRDAQRPDDLSLEPPAGEPVPAPAHHRPEQRPEGKRRPREQGVCASPVRPKVFAWMEAYLRMNAGGLSPPLCAGPPQLCSQNRDRRHKFCSTRHAATSPRGEAMFRHLLLLGPSTTRGPKMSSPSGTSVWVELKSKSSRGRAGNEPFANDVPLLGNVDH
jgi:hypothetical protein